ncbi:MAG: carbon-nitrogen hydrolase family protein [Saprospiraceae bacterium]|nr:carbon-nitrogen hydrolase family protein [Saprospiraceae bacterium]
MNQQFKVAAVQAAPVYLNKAQTVKKACKLIKEAADHGARMVVFPEAFIPGYPDWIWLIPNSKSADLNALYLELVRNSVSESDESIQQIAAAAQENGIYVAMGMNERNEESSNASLYNSIFYFDDQGRLIGKHRKLIPTSAERLIWARGDGRTMEVYTTPFGKISGLICWENYMPLARAFLYEKGVQVLAAPTWDKSPGWLNAIQFIAREGGLFIISACQAFAMDDIPDNYEFKKLYPPGREWVNQGNSCIMGPNGKILAGPLEEQEGILYAEINPEDIVVAKRMFDAAGHYGRPDVFQLHVKDDPKH